MASSGIPALYSLGHLNTVLLGRSAGPVPEHSQLCKALLCVSIKWNHWLLTEHSH